MSLTILIHNKTKSVAIIRWFLDSKVSIAYASGPVAEMTCADFRASGYDWVQHHLAEFAKVRISENDVVLPFAKNQGKRFMADRDVVEIHFGEAGEMQFIPAVVRQYNLGRGLEILEAEKRRSIPTMCSPELFWRTFDEVRGFSHEYSIT